MLTGLWSEVSMVSVTGAWFSLGFAPEQIAASYTNSDIAVF